MQSQQSTTLILFAKAPIQGYAKTRLSPCLGAKGAANLHKILVQMCLHNLYALPNCQLQIHYSEAHPFFLQLSKRFKASLHAQKNGNLGQRIQHAFDSQKNKGRTLLMGSDCPSITTQYISQCIRALQNHDFVFLPAEDGGYGLIGTKTEQIHKLPQLLSEPPWGTENVMQHTRNKLRTLNASWSEPAVIWDVDRAEDLKRLQTLSYLGSGPTKGKRTIKVEPGSTVGSLRNVISPACKLT